MNIFFIFIIFVLFVFLAISDIGRATIDDGVDGFLSSLSIGFEETKKRLSSSLLPVTDE